MSASASAQDAAGGEALFNRGMERMDAGDFEHACPAIAESYRLDPRPGTLFTLAECESRRGRLATAYARYGDYLALYDTLPAEKQRRQQGRDRVAKDQRTALGRQVPELTISLGPAAPRDGIVKRDDLILAGASLGVPLPVDPGEHVVTLEVPGKPRVERRVSLAPGEKKVILVDAVELPPAAATPPPPPRAAAAPSPPPAPLSGPGPSKQRIAAYATGGVGVAGLAVGAIFGSFALSKKGTVSSECGVGGDATACSPAGLKAVDAGRTFGNVSTVGFVAGGALLATGVVLFVTDRRQAPPAQSAATVPRFALVPVEGFGAAAGLRGGF
jgi:hypothetical protein